MWVDRAGFRIHCTVIGVGPTVVLQTGGAGDGLMWREHLPFLTDFRVVLVDHRGRGQTDHAGTVDGHRMSEYVADLVAVIDALGTPRAGFVGYSMGAQVGYALAAGHPDRVASMVGLGVTWGEPLDDDDAELISTLRTSGMAAVVAALEDAEQITMPAWLREQFLATDAEQFALSLEALSDWVPDHGAVSCPALLVAGTEEDPDRVNTRAAGQMPQGRAAYLPGLGHVGAFMAAREQCELAVPHLMSTMG